MLFERLGLIWKSNSNPVPGLRFAIWINNTKLILRQNRYYNAVDCEFFPRSKCSFT